LESVCQIDVRDSMRPSLGWMLGFLRVFPEHLTERRSHRITSNYLSHQTLVSKSSAPMRVIAALTLALLTEISELG
jgi:hypothetical protein